tara:strand:- start:49 stop:273 length:225 start_codon:yes stop_codon:yes gene_type:complete
MIIETNANLNKFLRFLETVRSAIQLATITIIDKTRIIKEELLDEKIYTKKYPMINNCIIILPIADIAFFHPNDQ